MMDVVLLSVNDVAARLPNFTALSPVKFVPVIVTLVPPATGPPEGDIEVTVGPATYVKMSDGDCALIPPGVVTVTSTTPVPGGATAVIDVVLPTV